MSKPFSESCERNRVPISKVLIRAFADRKHVLEIGSGTGQHAAFFALSLPHVWWQPSDLPVHHEGIKGWIKGCKETNIAQPVTLDVTQPWPTLTHGDPVDAIFSANTLHIMPLNAVKAFFEGAGKTLPVGGKLVVYGPFKYGGEYTSESNQTFDQWVKDTHPGGAIRDSETIFKWAHQQGFELLEDVNMPSNNQLLYWQKRPSLWQKLRGVR